jgi:predicted RND superfamily exporter protein
MPDAITRPNLDPPNNRAVAFSVAATAVSTFAVVTGVSFGVALGLSIGLMTAGVSACVMLPSMLVLRRVEQSRLAARARQPRLTGER